MSIDAHTRAILIRDLQIKRLDSERKELMSNNTESTTTEQEATKTEKLISAVEADLFEGFGLSDEEHRDIIATLRQVETLRAENEALREGARDSGGKNMTDTEKYVVVIERDCWRQEDWPARDAAIAALRAFDATFPASEVGDTNVIRVVALFSFRAVTATPGPSTYAAATPADPSSDVTGSRPARLELGRARSK